ncbi:MAG: hypothetical protein WD737_10490 [Gemmatimonadota bacterium]
MSSGNSVKARGAWLNELVDGAYRAFAFRRDPALKPPARPRPTKRGKRAARSAERTASNVAKLAAAGITRQEIARRTGLSQDTVSLLMNLSGSEAAESAGSGTFFRTLQAKLAT